jgi:biopolymer transport protein ExbD
MRAHARAGLLADINVTPFVDIMLVLLVIFMVTAPFMDQGIPVTVALPQAGSSQAVSRSGMIIVLTKEHMVYLDEELVTLKELRRRLSQAPDQPILIRADQSAYVKRLVELWDLCREMGFRQIHVATAVE